MKFSNIREGTQVELIVQAILSAKDDGGICFNSRNPCRGIIKYVRKRDFGRVAGFEPFEETGCRGTYEFGVGCFRLVKESPISIEQTSKEEEPFVFPKTGAWGKDFFQKLSPEQFSDFYYQHFSYKSRPSSVYCLEENYPYDITNDDIDDFGDLG